MKEEFECNLINNYFVSVVEWVSDAYFFTYIVTITLNLVLFLLIILRKQLHKPVYIFLAYLLLMDIIGSTTVLPRLMYSIIINNQTRISLCFIQAFFISFYAAMETYILGIMAIDRYLAVCHPSQSDLGHTVWCLLTTSVYPMLLLERTFCKDVLPNVGCVFIAVAKLSCEDITVNSMYGIAMTSIIFAYIIAIVFITYGLILYECLCSAKDSEGRSKALHTCVTHCMVLSLFLFSFLFSVISLRLSAGKSFSHVFKHTSDSMIYLLQPLANPIIYGFRMTEIRHSFLMLHKMIMQKFVTLEFSQWTA
uniref:G-protein coupled receptors family 1 profile domain-containing protein n=1 Tax=Eptatretus burgeri TaxID=7764 RepID=A0A8C4QFS8_EPTBU